MKIILHATNTFESPFWDGASNELGTYKSFIFENKEYKIKFKGFKQWYAKSNQYDPFLFEEDFNPEGMDKWISKGYEFAMMLRELLPKEIEVCYGFYQYLAGEWRFCSSNVDIK